MGGEGLVGHGGEGFVEKLNKVLQELAWPIPGSIDVVGAEECELGLNIGKFLINIGDDIFGDLVY
jgi:hypothetical protein